MRRGIFFLLSFVSVLWAVDTTYAIGKEITVAQLIVLGFATYILLDNRYKILFTLLSIVIAGLFMYLYMFATVGIQGILAMLADDGCLGGKGKGGSGHFRFE